MHVLDMIEPRKQMLQKEVISIKQPSQHTMMILLVNSCLKLQFVIHTWVLIHPVNRKCCKGTFKAPCLVALRMLLQLTYCCLHNHCEY